MVSQKVTFSVFLSFRRKPESSKFNMFWMPDQVRHDDAGTFLRNRQYWNLEFFIFKQVDPLSLFTRLTGF